MLAEIAVWWLGQMRALAPGIFTRTGQKQDALIAAIDEHGPDTNITGTLLLRRNGLETSLQALDLDHPSPVAASPHLATGLRLPPGAMLCREVMLPLAASRDLQTTLGFEMDRLTPFTAEEVYWSISGLTPDRARDTLRLRLAIVLRAEVDALSAALARCNFVPSFVETEAGRIELHTVRRRPIQKLGTAFCALLAFACLATPFLRQQMALDEAAQAIAATTLSAHTALALRQKLATAAQGRTAIAQARHAGDALQVLATLTSALPDGTWLGDLTLKSGDLTFDGQSTDAAKLIGLLSAVPGLRDPSFTAPVTRTIDGKADLFSLHASVAQ